MRKFLSFLLIFICLDVFSQDNYEIQVYASPTMTKGITMFELHSNYTFDGEKEVVGGVIPSYHALHETLEITQGIAKNFELGFYLFTNYTSGYGYHIVGSHLRPRVAAPDSWKLPVGLSLSLEFGYQKKEYSAETWSLEIRPIIDKQLGKFYLSLNPTLGVTLKGAGQSDAPSFAPNFKASYAISSKVSVGAEYYGDLGPINNFESAPDQSQAIYAAVDLYVNPKWEINFGPGWGLTQATDRFLFKLILGRRVSWKKKSE